MSAVSTDSTAEKKMLAAIAEWINAGTKEMPRGAELKARVDGAPGPAPGRLVSVGLDYNNSRVYWLLPIPYDGKSFGYDVSASLDYFCRCETARDVHLVMAGRAKWMINTDIANRQARINEIADQIAAFKGWQDREAEWCAAPPTEGAAT